MKHRFRWLGILFGILFLALVVLAVSRPGFRYRVDALLRQAGLMAPQLPLYVTPNAPPDRVTARRLLIGLLYEALARGDYEEVAALNSVLAQEAFQRAHQTLKAWETVRDPQSGLIPWVVSPWYQQWEPEAAAGNLYPHLVIASYYLDPTNESQWEKTLATERKLCGALPCVIDIGKLSVKQLDLDNQIKAATEYSRDGLLSVIERFGRVEPWFSRLVELANGVLDSANVQSRSGAILSNGTEVNGCWLQVFSRLYWLTGDARYLGMAERIADTYLFEVIPTNRGLTANYWDFANSKPLPEDPRIRPVEESIPGVYVFSLMDHGGEIIPGLAELYFLEKSLNRPQAERYRQPIQDFLDRVLRTGRTSDGLWVRSINLSTGKPFNSQLVDTWGYILSAHHTFDLAEGTQRYAPSIQQMMRQVTTKRSIDWEYGPQADGYADTIESMLYLLPWFDIPEARQWIDDEIEVLFLKQRANGFVEEWYLDGNFVRTSLLYGFWKTQGIWLDPWVPHTRVGAGLDRSQDKLYIYIAGEDEWQGVLHFDTPRHQTIWNMPIDYPRVNGLPEWYVIEPTRVYDVTDLATNVTSTYTGKDLAKGLPVVLGKSPHNTLRLVVSKR